MRLSRVVTPYLHASGHPIIHMSLFICVLQALDQKEASQINVRGLHWMLYMHMIAILIDTISQCYRASMNKRSVQGNENLLIISFLKFVKTFAYFISVTYAQHEIFEFIYNQNQHIGEKGFNWNSAKEYFSEVQAFWLIIEVIVFYLQVFSMMFVLFFSTCWKYKPLKERFGAASNKRFTEDFLDFASEHIHWSNIYGTLLLLFGFSVW